LKRSLSGNCGAFGGAIRTDEWPPCLCYDALMTTKSAPKQKPRRTTMVPVTTMEELPILDEKERVELLASLKEAEGQIKSGRYTDYEPKAFKDRLVRIYRGKKR